MIENGEKPEIPKAIIMINSFRLIWDDEVRQLSANQLLNQAPHAHQHPAFE